LVGLVLGDLAEDAAHDFAGAGFRQAGRELDLSGTAIGPDFFAHVQREFLFQIPHSGSMWSLSVMKAYEALAFDLVRHRGDGGFGNFRVAHQRASTSAVAMRWNQMAVNGFVERFEHALTNPPENESLPP